MQLTPMIRARNGEEYRLLFARAPVTFLGILIWPGHAFAVLYDRDSCGRRDVAAARALLVRADRRAYRKRAARSPPALSTHASARRSPGAETRSERWRGTSTRWPSASRRS